MIGPVYALLQEGDGSFDSRRLLKTGPVIDLERSGDRK